MKKISTIFLILCTSSLLLASTKQNKTNDVWDKRCASCHGTVGQKRAMKLSDAINQYSQKEIKDALIGYKKGTYGRTMKLLMKEQVKHLSTKDINYIAKKIGVKE